MRQSLSATPESIGLRRLARICAIAAAAIPAIAMIGWIGDIAILRQVVPAAKSMNPLTAVSLIAAAAALWMSADDRIRPILPRTVALLPIVIGLGRILDSLGTSLEFDVVLFRAELEPIGASARMAVGTGICLLCIGCVLLFHRRDSAGDRRLRFLLVPAVLIALLGGAGYLFGARSLVSMPALSTIALNTVLALLALCLGLTAIAPAVPPASTMFLAGTAGAAARRLLPAAFLLPFVVGGLRILGERAGWYAGGFGTALTAVTNASLMTILVLLTVWLVQREEAKQKVLELGIRESEQRLFQILEAIPIGVFVRNRDGKPYYSNRVGEEISGLKAMTDLAPGELSRRYNVYRRGTNELYPSDRLPGARALQGERVHLDDIEIHRADRIIPVEVWACPVQNPEGETEFAISAYNDITERLESERKIESLNQELQHQLAELAAVNGELETFSYSVSHDLRAPLRAVDGFSRMLSEDHAAALGPDGQRLLERIRANVRRMGLLIDDLLRFSRLSRQELEAASVDMAGLARAVVEDLSRGKDHRLPVVIGALPPSVGDVNLLRQVWTNLIDNGLKYSAKSSDPRVEVGGQANGREVIYWVKDNGVGFDMKYAGKLFGVFQRLHSQDEFEGTGVGLAIVQRVIHRHGGRVWAEGELGGGATFSFSLPVGGTNDAG